GIDTTLLVHPLVLAEFLDFNDFLDEADALLEAMELDGVLQVASFHPDYQFADSGPDDVENLTNRAPWPILHLLREDSVARAVEAFPDPDAIGQRNIERVRALGFDGWQRLLADDDPGPPPTPYERLQPRPACPGAGTASVPGARAVAAALRHHRLQQPPHLVQRGDDPVPQRAHLLVRR